MVIEIVGKSSRLTKNIYLLSIGGFHTRIPFIFEYQLKFSKECNKRRIAFTKECNKRRIAFTKECNKRRIAFTKECNKRRIAYFKRVQ